MIKNYYSLVKPGIVYGNVLVAAAGFIFASHGEISWPLFAYMLAGLSLVVAAACVFNNIADKSLDAKMSRTAMRALAAGKVTTRAAFIYGLVLLALGAVLLSQTNVLALGVALVGFVVYVFAYTPLKPRSGSALYVGAIAGAVPPVVGYVAVVGDFDWYAAALFALLYLWQVPHFLAIARYRFSEYRAAGVPLWVREPHTDSEKRQARVAFLGSLILLLVICALLVALAFV